MSAAMARIITVKPAAMAPTRNISTAKIGKSPLGRKGRHIRPRE